MTAFVVQRNILYRFYRTQSSHLMSVHNEMGASVSNDLMSIVFLFAKLVCVFPGDRVFSFFLFIELIAFGEMAYY